MRKTKTKKLPILNIVLILLLILLIGITVTTSMLCNNVLAYDKIYKGIYIDGIHIGELTKEEAIDLLNERLQDKVDAHIIHLDSFLYSGDISFSDLKVIVNIEQLVNDAYAIGREGNNLQRIQTIIDSYENNNNFASAITYSTDTLNSYIAEIQNYTHIAVSEPTYVTTETKTTITSGHDGKDVDTTLLHSMIDEDIFALVDSNIDIPIITTQRKQLDGDAIFLGIHVDPIDAVYDVVNNEAIVLPHAYGQSTNRDNINNIVSSIEDSPDETWEITYFSLSPEIYSHYLKSKMYQTVLSSFETQYYIGDKINKNRGINIALASNKIDGKVLGPGDEFSFNSVVGQRTVEAGYQVAHVYINGEIVDGLAGGICQVSTTLYNTVLRAGLDTTERGNHQFSVGYADLGFDATVSYGSIDFKFINNTDYPVKLKIDIVEVGVMSTLRIQLIGTNDNPSLSYETKTEILKTIAYKSVQDHDANLYIGQQRIEQEGKTGYLVDAFLITKKGDEIISEEYLHQDYYNSHDELIFRGTTPLPENETLESLGLPEILHGKPEEPEDVSPEA